MAQHRRDVSEPRDLSNLVEEIESLLVSANRLRTREPDVLAQQLQVKATLMLALSVEHVVERLGKLIELAP